MNNKRWKQFVDKHSKSQAQALREEKMLLEGRMVLESRTSTYQAEQYEHLLREYGSGDEIQRILDKTVSDTGVGKNFKLQVDSFRQPSGLHSRIYIKDDLLPTLVIDWKLETFEHIPDASLALPSKFVLQISVYSPDMSKRIPEYREEEWDLTSSGYDIRKLFNSGLQRVWDIIKEMSSYAEWARKTGKQRWLQESRMNNPERLAKLSSMGDKKSEQELTIEKIRTGELESLEPEEAYRKALRDGKPSFYTRYWAIKDPQYAYYYAKDVDKRPSDTTREGAIKEPRYAYYYAKSVDGGPSDATREGAIKEPRYAYYYARDVDGGPSDTTWEEAIKDPQYAYYYAKSVDGGPSDATREEAIKKPKYAYLYAANVDKGFHSETWGAVLGTPWEPSYLRNVPGAREAVEKLKAQSSEKQHLDEAINRVLKRNLFEADAKEKVPPIEITITDKVAVERGSPDKKTFGPKSFKLKPSETNKISKIIHKDYFGVGFLPEKGRWYWASEPSNREDRDDLMSGFLKIVRLMTITEDRRSMSRNVTMRSLDPNTTVAREQMDQIPD